MKRTSPWHLRRARRADVSDLLDLMAAFNRAEGIRFRRAHVALGLRRLLRARRLGIVVVAEAAKSKGIIGYAVGTFGFDLEFGGPDAFVTELFVRPPHRRGGLGARLLEATVSALKDGGAGAVHLGVWPENRAARRLYARAGFVETRRLMMTRVLPRAGSRQ
jgi:ribosomal protein S18 acetylase RimI-like enzyme